MSLDKSLGSLLGKLPRQPVSVSIKSTEDKQPKEVDENFEQQQLQEGQAVALTIDIKIADGAFELSLSARHLLVVLRSLISLFLPPPPSSPPGLLTSQSSSFTDSIAAHEKISGIVPRPLTVRLSQGGLTDGPRSGAVLSRAAWSLQSILCSVLDKAIRDIQASIHHARGAASDGKGAAGDGASPLARIESEALDGLIEMLSNSVRLGDKEAQRSSHEISAYWPSKSEKAPSTKNDGPRSVLRSLCLQIISLESKRTALLLLPSSSLGSTLSTSPPSHRDHLMALSLEKAICAYLSFFGPSDEGAERSEVFQRMVSLVGSPHDRVRRAVADYFGSCVANGLEL